MKQAIFATMLAVIPCAVSAQTLVFSPNVYLNAGQSAIINGARSPQCGAPAPDWATVRTWLPPTELGTYADAGIRTKFSDSCRMEVKVRAVRFTARKQARSTCACSVTS